MSELLLSKAYGSAILCCTSIGANYWILCSSCSEFGYRMGLNIFLQTFFLASLQLGAYWFPSSEPSLKRRDIQKLIYDLLENHSEESSPASSTDKCYPRKSPKAGNAREFLPESSGTSKGYSVNLLCTQAQKGVEMALFPASSLRASCADDSGMASRDAYNSGSAAGSLIELQYQAFDRMASFNELKSAMASLQVFQPYSLL